MTKSEKEVILFLMYDGGADYCQTCIHLNKESCGRYVSPTDYSGECSDDYCIAGMVKHFEQTESNPKNSGEDIKTKLGELSAEIQALPDSSGNGQLIDALSHAQCAEEHLRRYFMQTQKANAGVTE